MATTSDIIDDIKADLQINDSAYDALILRAIQSALRELRGGRYWFLESFGTLTASASTSTIDIASAYSDFGVMKSIDLIAGGQRYYDRQGFNLLPFDELRSRYWLTETLPTERPEACAVFDATKTLYLSCNAASAYSLPFVYYKQDATLPAAGESSVWFDDGYDVVRTMAQYIFKRDAQGMTVNEADADMVMMAKRALSDAHVSHYRSV